MTPFSRTSPAGGESRWLVVVALVVAGTVRRPAEEAEEEALQARDRPLGYAAVPAAGVR